MKVYINNYRNHWLSPYTIMEKVLFWKKWAEPDFDLYDDKNKHYIDWLVKPMQAAQKCLDVVHPKINYVKIDFWDTWNMDSTLSIIILPMLKQLHANKHGGPTTDDADVPEGLRSTDAPPKENEWDVDENWFKRWDWIMDEMIWTFEQKQPDCDWEHQYYSGVHDTSFRAIEWGADGKALLHEQVKGPNDTFKVDREGMDKHQERINNGMKLFGKYYQGLWD